MLRGPEGISANCVPHSGQMLLGQVLLEARRRYAKLLEERGSGAPEPSTSRWVTTRERQSLQALCRHALVTPNLRDGILTRDRGHLSIALRRTTFDVDAFLELSRKSGMPHADWWIGCWVRE